MKIAVATVDGESVSQHFGQSTGFIVFEVEDQQVKSRILRTPADTPHNEGVCHGEGGGVLGLLQGCNVLICGGMGGGAASAVQSAGIQPVVLPGVLHAEDAVKTFLEGKGNNAAAGYCQCDHHHS
jgi:predicted Fe-Mo cluster-binding NifX family protein